MSKAVSLLPKTFEYSECKVKDLVAHTTTSPTGKVTVHQIDANGQSFEPTQRFWTSIQARFGFSKNIFKFFTHEEVFNRISEKAPNDKLRMAIEKGEAPNGKKEQKLLAVTNPTNVVIPHDDLLGLLDKQGVNVKAVDYGMGTWRGRGGSIDPNGIRVGQVGGPLGQTFDAIASQPLPSAQVSHDAEGMRIRLGNVLGQPRWTDQSFEDLGLSTVSYHDGVIRSIHTPRNGQDFQIAGDEFSNKFVMDIPIDGFGKPAAYLMLLRQICANGSIGYSSVFRSEIALGKGEDKFDFALTRAIEGFNNEEGFGAMRQRFEQAAKSWASINEVNKAYKVLLKLHHNGELRGIDDRFFTSEKHSTEGNNIADGSPIIQSFNKMVGDLHRAYGLANLDALGVKRQRTLPTGAKMYEMLNFLSETATHHASPAGAKTIQALTGDFIATEYDLEGTVDKFGDWKDFLIKDKNAAAAKAAALRL